MRLVILSLCLLGFVGCGQEKAPVAAPETSQTLLTCPVCEQRFEAFGCEGMAPKIRPVALDQMVRRYA